TMIWQPEFTDKTLSRKPGAVHLDDYKTGVITQIQAVGRIGNVFSALESGDSKKVVHLLTEGRKLLRTG
ncbi:hypothetical protein SND17_16325, partial [Escherichia coli]|nr:hypothetical protein [Escherichia coli]